jgi:hypothetical protein
MQWVVLDRCPGPSRRSRRRHDDGGREPEGRAENLQWPRRKSRLWLEINVPTAVVDCSRISLKYSGRALLQTLVAHPILWMSQDVGPATSLVPKGKRVYRSRYHPSYRLGLFLVPSPFGPQGLTSRAMQSARGIRNILALATAALLGVVLCVGCGGDRVPNGQESPDRPQPVATVVGDGLVPGVQRAPGPTPVTTAAPRQPIGVPQRPVPPHTPVTPPPVHVQVVVTTTSTPPAATTSATTTNPNT